MVVWEPTDLRVDWIGARLALLSNLPDNELSGLSSLQTTLSFLHRDADFHGNNVIYYCSAEEHKRKNLILSPEFWRISGVFPELAANH